MSRFRQSKCEQWQQTFLTDLDGGMFSFLPVCKAQMEMLEEIMFGCTALSSLDSCIWKHLKHIVHRKWGKKPLCGRGRPEMVTRATPQVWGICEKQNTARQYIFR